jgi:hypothetical protein
MVSGVHLRHRLEFYRMTIAKLKFAWKHRRPLWKYRRLLRHRRAIGVAAAAGAAGVAAWLLLRGTSTPATASND